MPRLLQLGSVLFPVIYSISVAAAEKPFPTVQVVPLPGEQISFQWKGREITRYHHGTALPRPFLFPFNGPSGINLTRLGHPHDPVSHSHHNSIWISHRDLNGLNFWEDRGAGHRIQHQRVEQFFDSPDEASATVLNHWLSASNQLMLVERRRITLIPLPLEESLLLIDLELKPGPRGLPMVFGKSPFGLLAVRVTKTMGVADGGGTIRNSEGGVDEAGVLWKKARWVDYSGPVTPEQTQGLTLLDHPSNAGHPTFFHVRNDGWMGASLSYDASLTVPTNGLVLRYGLYAHRGLPDVTRLQEEWEKFAARPRRPLDSKPRE